MTTMTLADVDEWFDKKILPARTASPGFSGNRIVKGPRAGIFGNRPDPNGVCGDAAYYVSDKYVENSKFAVNTKDGYTLGRIVWEGLVFNHTANVMLRANATYKQIYEMKSGVLVMLNRTKKEEGLKKDELFALHVYDLYYKKRATVGSWWKDLDSGYGGKLTLALEQDL